MLLIHHCMMRLEIKFFALKCEQNSKNTCHSSRMYSTMHAPCPAWRLMYEMCLYICYNATYPPRWSKHLHRCCPSSMLPKHLRSTGNECRKRRYTLTFSLSCVPLHWYDFLSFESGRCMLRAILKYRIINFFQISAVFDCCIFLH